MVPGLHPHALPGWKSAEAAAQIPFRSRYRRRLDRMDIPDITLPTRRLLSSFQFDFAAIGALDADLTGPGEPVVGRAWQLYLATAE